MSLFFTVADWMKLLQAIYQVYNTFDRRAYPREMLELLHQIIPYSKGVFCITEPAASSTMRVVTTEIFGRNISEKYLQALKEQLQDNDFIHSICSDAAGPVMRGPITASFAANLDLQLGETVISADLDHAISCSLYYEHYLLGYIILWRDAASDGYIQRDVCTLTYLKTHLALQLYKFSPIEQTAAASIEALGGKVKKYGLTKREVEVLYYAYAGMSEAEICGALCISVSTFRKHLNHIYNKMNVSSKVKLIKLVETELS